MELEMKLNIKESELKKDQSFFVGLDFYGSITIIFVFLKLMGDITCSWWWILSPLIFRFIILEILLFIVSKLLKCLK